MNNGDLRRKLSMAPDDFDIYVHCGDKFYKIDSVKIDRDDEETIILTFDESDVEK